MIISLQERLFRGSDAKRAQLLDALRIPAVAEALSIQMEVPTKEPSFVPGVPLDTTLAHEFCKMIGANRINSALIRMTQPLGKSTEELEEASQKDEEPWKWAEDTVKTPVLPTAPSQEPAPRTKRKYTRKAQ